MVRTWLKLKKIEKIENGKLSQKWAYNSDVANLPELSAIEDFCEEPRDISGAGMSSPIF